MKNCRAIAWLEFCKERDPKLNWGKPIRKLSFELGGRGGGEGGIVVDMMTVNSFFKLTGFKQKDETVIFYFIFVIQLEPFLTSLA